MSKTFMGENGEQITDYGNGLYYSSKYGNFSGMEVSGGIQDTTNGRTIMTGGGVPIGALTIAFSGIVIAFIIGFGLLFLSELFLDNAIPEWVMVLAASAGGCWIIRTISKTNCPDSILLAVVIALFVFFAGTTTFDALLDYAGATAGKEIVHLVFLVLGIVIVWWLSLRHWDWRGILKTSPVFFVSLVALMILSYIGLVPLDPVWIILISLGLWWLVHWLF